MSVLDLQQMRRADGACILSIEGTIDESTVGPSSRGSRMDCRNRIG